MHSFWTFQLDLVRIVGMVRLHRLLEFRVNEAKLDSVTD